MATDIRNGARYTKRRNKWYMNHTKEKNHFYYQDLGITIKKHKRDMERRKAQSKEYYQTHKAECIAATKLWRTKNKNKVNGYREKMAY